MEIDAMRKMEMDVDAKIEFREGDSDAMREAEMREAKERTERLLERMTRNVP